MRTLFKLPRQINPTPQHYWEWSRLSKERPASRGPALWANSQLV
jgi:hypothetical protein